LAEIREFSFQTTYIIADIDLELIEKVVTLNDTFIPTNVASPKYINVDVPQLHSNRFFRNVLPYPFIPEETEARDKVCREVFNIQSTGLARRLLHTNVEKVVLGVSGGLDSTLALLVSLKAFEKLGYSHRGIHAVLMPGFGTSKRTFTLAKELAKSLDVSIKAVDIRKSVALHLKEIGASSAANSLVFENAQARERTQILMDLANHLGGIVVGTGDLSEIALGWSTYNADHMSMYNVNATVPKTLIRYIIDWVAHYHHNKQVQKVLKSILELPSSPELLENKCDRPNQITEEIIGPFELNDFFLYYSNRYAFSPKKILFLSSLAFKGKYSIEEIKKWLKNYFYRFFVNQFKRSCMPDGPKVGYVDLSPRGSWRMPSDADFALWVIENL
ncbi:MAG: NAD(+) synthase, partial [Candidatus Kapaibacteriota bacterium]